MDNALKIQGVLRYILQGLEHTNFSEKDIVGSDIKDDKGAVIGVITGVDFDNDLWYGELFNPVVKIESSNSTISITTPESFCDDCVHQRGYLNPTCACCSRFPHNK